MLRKLGSIGYIGIFNEFLIRGDSLKTRQTFLYYFDARFINIKLARVHLTIIYRTNSFSKTWVTL